ncbi:RagB/SusD family nutrient uptake outer membrane protein [Salegentibacter maritimus]|uniref:RagB/SusD family nutrient uptake outer membrane protein n=1 Tax=Salegentibacter maritimus TaxID=2794347 RepID=UPI0018E4CA5C|nr:RagB/SusD family nutrient uptake outer membrane protein [Salegentibacter maritimus]MBI6118015.1 RagB/SusD family nutrient uptake outer membrane protein [Salegentibacter maritimus]
MKKILLYISALALLLQGCEDDFLDRIPETDITGENFFNNPKDLETYTNEFYDYLGVSTSDYSTDNMAQYSQGSELEDKLRGTISPETVNGGWNWAQLRNINYLLTNYREAEGDKSEINHYVGIAKYFRARFYIAKIKRFGSVPWYSKPIETGDENLLYKPNDSRELVVDSIMSDLEFAVKHINESSDKTRLSKWAVMAELSRFCLYEGTFRKYHDEISIDDSERFLNRAASAANEIISSGNFSLYSTGNASEDYRNLFAMENQSSNPEAIMYLDYNSSERTNQNGVVFDYYWGLSKSLADSYLMADGTSFTASVNNEQKSITEIFKNRDPRMAQTIMAPGYTRPGSPSAFVTRLSYGGYNQIKFWPKEENKLGWQRSYNDLMIYRYSEVLLNYAEAKAELGIIAQADIDKSINKLRDRVGMPHLDIASANSSLDPALVKQYPNIEGENQGLILELRRERRVELACEGFREQDMYRWKAGTTMAKPQFGIYISELGEHDVTGDGIPDIAVLNSPDETSPINDVPDSVKSTLAIYYLNEEGAPTDLYLSNGNQGFIGFNQDNNVPKSFIEPQYYYYPIPLNELVLNPNLEQPTGW